MIVFVDTSALYAVLDRTDEAHERAAVAWDELLVSSTVLVSTNYIEMETAALVQHRLGTKAIALLYRDVWPVIERHWVQPDDHAAALSALLTAGRRKLSLVDCSSFEVMRRRGITTAFTLDKHFRQQGFEVMPR